jgi:hypothetical protein
MVIAGVLPFRENSDGRAGNRTQDLMISNQKLLPLDHEIGRIGNYKKEQYLRNIRQEFKDGFNLTSPKEASY